MKLTRIFASVILALASLTAMAQYSQYTIGGSTISLIGGRIFYAQEYSLKAANVYLVSGNSVTGSSTVSLSTGSVKLRYGRTVVPFYVGETLQINDANQETVTVTAVTNCLPTGQVQDTENPAAILCQITATFANLHGAGAWVWSASGGYLEALNDAGNSGGGEVFFSIDCGYVTLSTSGATTTTTCNVPKTFVNGGGGVYVKTAVTTAASYSLGVASSTASFINTCTNLTAGTNCGQFEPTPNTVATGTGVGPLLVTANATAGAGVIHAVIWGYTYAQPNF